MRTTRIDSEYPKRGVAWVWHVSAKTDLGAVQSKNGDQIFGDSIAR